MALRSRLKDRYSRRQITLVGGALALVLAIAWIAFEMALAAAIANTAQQADRRLALFDRTLEAIIERFHFLPSTMAMASEVRDTLGSPADEAARTRANGFLSNLNDTAGVGEVFVMSRDGEVIAASNWWAYDSLVGHDFSYRPYFAEAMFDGDARFYAIGVATGVAGYFLAHRIDGPDGPLGVAVAKINLGEIEATWWRSGELIGIVDVNGAVILSTRPDWRYRPLLPLAPAAAARAATERRYGGMGIINDPVAADSWATRGTQFAYIAGDDLHDTSGYFLLEELRLPIHQWRLVSFTPVDPLFRSAWIAAAAAGLGCAALLLIIVLIVQRRRIVAHRLAEHDRLEQRVAERTQDLHVINEQLRDEIADRVRAEAAERQAQHGLVQAAKMASLGQALAGVAHEVSQPVTALTTHIASAKLLAAQRNDAETGQILSTMDKILDRLSALTGHLKTFARKETQVSMSAEVASVIANALDLVDHKLRTFGVDVDYARTGDIRVRGNPVHLEQVLINLFANAADAMEHSAVRVLSISGRQVGVSYEIAVTDTGSGMTPEAAATIFDPFYTTKDAGRGLGLGLSISYGLVRDTGGTIAVTSRPGRGSTFIVRLPLAQLSHPNREAQLA